MGAGEPEAGRQLWVASGMILRAVVRQLAYSWWCLFAGLLGIRFWAKDLVTGLSSIFRGSRPVMPLSGLGRVMRAEDNRTLIYVSQDVAKDSAWPFKPRERIAIRIEPDQRRVVLEKLPEPPPRGARPSPAAIMILGLLLISGCLGAADTQVPPAFLTSAAPASTRIAGPSDPEFPTHVGSIDGHVFDEELRPLSNATILMLHLNVRLLSDDTGVFQILDVPAGKHVVEAQAPGYGSQSKSVQIIAGETTNLQFTLAPLAVQEPHIAVLQHTTLIHHQAPILASLGSMVPGACSDNCSWWAPLLPQTKHVLIETFGRHSTSHPLGWDGLYVEVRGFPDNGSQYRYLSTCGKNGPREECFRLPIRIPLLNATLYDPTLTKVTRLQMRFECEPSWICVEEKYDTYASFFVDWEGEEIPPGYSAKPGG